MAVFWTALLGFAGVAAAFFAPPWTDRQITKRRDAADFRQARRLVAHELYKLMVDLQALAVMEYMWPPEGMGMLGTPTWDAYRPVLARALVNKDETAWLQVALVYQNIARLATSFELGKSEKMTDDQRASLLTAAKNAESARDALATEPGHATLEELFPRQSGTGS